MEPNVFDSGRLLLLNKPYRWTSFDVVKKVRHATRAGKVGHAGTLDPLATGLLIVCTGKLTKQIDTYQAQEKEYTGSFYLGATTPSFDLETEVNRTFDTSLITEREIYNATALFKGEILQSPPLHSAVNIDGQRAYLKARRGEQVEVPPRKVSIYSFEITRIEMPEIFFRVICSKGTYIRSLARDFGLALNSGAYLSSLCRTRIGDFNLEDALSVDEFVQGLKKEN